MYLAQAGDSQTQTDRAPAARAWGCDHAHAGAQEGMGSHVRQVLVRLCSTRPRGSARGDVTPEMPVHALLRVCPTRKTSYGEGELKCSSALKPILTLPNPDDLCCSYLDFAFLVCATGIR